MKRLFNILLLAVLIAPMALLANENPKFKGKYTKEKKLHKEYSVNAGASLTVDNSYGNIDIVSWDENRIVIDVTITTNGNNEEKVQKKLDNIEVEFSGNGSKVVARTLFRDRKSSSWSWWSNNDNNNVKMEVNYTIKMPVTNSVDLSNDYGSINLNKLEGNAKISCDYGQINIGQLMASNNSLNFDYTKNSTIGYMKSGRINADYSGFTIEKADYLEVNADYSHSEILEVKELNYNNDYGKISINKVEKLVGQGDYIPLRIETLTGSLNVNTDYGSVAVDTMTASVKDVVINSDYASIKLGYDANLNFKFNVSLSYANLSGEEDLEVMKTHKDYSSKTYEGYHGNQNATSTINIKSSYGGVTLRKL